MEIKSLKWGSKTMHCSGEQMRREILRNTGAEKFYHLPTYDFEIVLNGYNKYKTF